MMKTSLFFLLLWLTWCPKAFTQAKAWAELPECRISQETVRRDAAILQSPAPTFFRLMPSRYAEIVEAGRGYRCTGVHSVAFDGLQYFQAGHSDDWGLPELIPSVARVTHWSMAMSYDAIEVLLIVLTAASGLVGLWKLSHTRQARVAAVGCVALVVLLEFRVADVYVFQSAPMLCFIPWLVYLWRSRRDKLLLACAAAFVFTASWFSFVRSGTELICVALVLPLCLAVRSFWKAALCLLVVGLLCLPAWLFAHRSNLQRDELLARMGQRQEIPEGHPLWHSVYIGLAFIPNSEVPKYEDQSAKARVDSIDPAVPYMSKRYNLILRHVVFEMALHKPWIIIGNVLAKVAIMCVLPFVFLWPMRRTLKSRGKMTWIEWSFLLGGILSASGGILVIPRLAYVLSFICLTTLFATICYIEARGETLVAVSSLRRVRA